jgi:hypothetical protein
MANDKWKMEMENIRSAIRISTNQLPFPIWRCHFSLVICLCDEIEDLSSRAPRIIVRSENERSRHRSGSELLHPGYWPDI